MTLRVAIVGMGKIARDQHVPSIAAVPGVELVAVASPHSRMDGIVNFTSLEAMIDSGLGIDAVAICTPPQGRHRIAETALKAGLHVLLEKPPGATLAEIGPLERLAAEKGVTLFATWHSRFAAAVEPARAFLAERRIHGVAIEWKEDVRTWHPGQQWIWEPGGLGVFDPGINALSIITAVLPWPMVMASSSLSFPQNRAAPIAADLSFHGPGGIPVQVAFDWRQLGPQLWRMRFETDQGTLVLDNGGKQLFLDDRVLVDAENLEYQGIYRRFVSLTTSGASDVDLAPLTHVADAFMLGRRIEVEPFTDHTE